MNENEKPEKPETYTNYADALARVNALILLTSKPWHLELDPLVKKYTIVPGSSKTP